MPARVFNTENGLPHNRVNRILLDSHGSLWICTDDGLSRFDGHRFVSYNTASGLPHIHVNAIIETRGGDHWIGTDGGLSRFDPRPGLTRFTTYEPEGPPEARYINAIVEEPAGNLLVGTGAGMFRLTLANGNRVFESVDYRRPGDPPAARKVNALAYDARGRLWLATEHGLYRDGPDGIWTHYGLERGLPDHFVAAFAHDREGRLWAGFKSGFGRLALAPVDNEPVLDRRWIDKTHARGQEIRTIWFGSDGRRWIGTDIGLSEWFLDANGVPTFPHETAPSRLPKEAVLSLAEDPAGHLWVGTRRSGLLRAGRTPFQTFGAEEGLDLGRDQAVFETRSGRIAVFDIGDLRNRVYTQAGGRFQPTLPALPGDATEPSWLQSAAQDRTGDWWLSTARGLFRFPALDLQFDLRLLADRRVDRFFEDAAGDLWISNWTHEGARLARWRRSSGQVVDESHRLPAAAKAIGISAFAQDRTGSLWIGLQRPGGLLRLRDGRFETVPSGVRGHVAQLFLDAQGRLWVATTETGLGAIRDPTAAAPRLEYYSRRDGLSGDEVWCVTEDRLGRIYVGTPRGVDRLAPATGTITHYGSADGLISGDIRSAFRDRAGNLWFASASGLARLTPQADRELPPSQARLTGVRRAGVAVPLSEFGETRVGPMRLGPSQNSLQVEFAATDFHQWAPLRFQFQLTRDRRTSERDAWQDLGTTSTVHLANLAAGSYTFVVRAITANGRPGAGASLTFTVLRPFWQTWWFPLASGIGVTALVFLVHAQRLRGQLGIERVRSRIAMDLHDDIGASLSRMSVLSEALRSGPSLRDASAQRMLDDIAQSSRQLVRDLGDIVWSLDPRRDQTGDLVSRLRAFGSDLLETHGVEWAVDSLLEDSPRSLPAHVRRELFLVFKEGIHNVARHSQATKAALRLLVCDGAFDGELIDDGRGVGDGRSGGGTGLTSMRARVARLGGTIDVATTSDGGTRLRVVVPLPGRG
jgi:ligand-binding sensor domain-containing protein/signal transduction histidine kinase